jgi:hypothetical protein
MSLWPAHSSGPADAVKAGDLYLYPFGNDAAPDNPGEPREQVVRSRLGEQLRGVIRDLVVGDNLMSLWIFGMSNPREPAPQMLIAAYKGVVERWVFEPVWNLLSHADGDCDGVSGDDRWHGGFS